MRQFQGGLNVQEFSEGDKLYFRLRVGLDLRDMEQFSLKVGLVLEKPLEEILASGWA